MEVLIQRATVELRVDADELKGHRRRPCVNSTTTMTTSDTAMKSVAMTYACCARRSPGRESSCEMSSGRVVEFRLERKLDAPNSPRETAAARAQADAIGRLRSGPSIVDHERHREAPSVIADALRSRGIADTACDTTIATSGMAMREWASGVMIQLERRSNTPSSKVTRKPSPTTTAEMVSGRAVNVENALAQRPP
jgi:hypothetical protein